MQACRQVRQFLASTDGYVISTEKILALTLVLGVLVVGVAALRNSLRSYFLDEIDAIAACTNMFVFDPDEVQVMATEDFDVLFPDLATQSQRPEPTPASKE
jgi:hypothetical protein